MRKQDTKNTIDRFLEGNEKELNSIEAGKVALDRLVKSNNFKELAIKYILTEGIANDEDEATIVANDIVNTIWPRLSVDLPRIV